jgi:hypothetical protein
LKLKSVAVSPEISSFLDNIKNEFDVFFNFKISDPLLFLLYNHEDLDIIWGKRTEPWFVGAFKNNSIFILNPDVYESESNHKKEEFWMHLKHEYCHVYYTQITGVHYPVWLNEGLASLLSGKKLAQNNIDKSKLLSVCDYFKTPDRDVYAIGHFWIKYLIDNFGKDKLLSLIYKIDKGVDAQKFSEEFYRVYGVRFNKESLNKLLD